MLNSILPKNLGFLEKRGWLRDLRLLSQRAPSHDLQIGIESPSPSLTIDGITRIVPTENSPLSLEQTESLPQFERLAHYCIYGFDTGIYIREILKNFQASNKLLVLEPLHEWFLFLCTRDDLSDILQDPRFEILLGSEPIAPFMGRYFEPISGFEKFQILERPQPILPHGEGFTTYLAESKKWILSGIQKTGIIKRTGDLSFQYYLKNTPTGLRCGDIDHLREAIQGKPYIVVGSGPSTAYRDQMDLLREIQDRAFIAAADNSMKELVDNGIDPDLIFHVEWRRISLDFYENLNLRKPAVLCYVQSVHPEILEKWPYDKVAYPAVPVELVFGELVERGKWPEMSANNVGDMAIFMGIHAKASEIYLVGMDFSCPAGSYHHPNTALMRESYGEVNRFNSVEKKDWHHVSNTPKRTKVEGWDGEEIFSFIGIKYGIEHLSFLRKQMTADQQLFTTSKMGAKIEAELRQLQDLKTLPVIDKNLRPSQNLVSDMDALRVVEKRKKQLQGYFRVAQEFSKACQSFQEAIAQDKKNSDPQGYQAIYQHYLNHVKLFQSQHDVVWLENLILQIDTSVALRAGRLQRRMQDVQGEELIREQVDSFMEYLKIIFSYRDLLIQHIDHLHHSFSHHG